MADNSTLSEKTKMPVSLVLALLTAAIANVTAIFTIPEKVLERADERYVRKDVNESQLRSLEFKIDELRRAVERGK